MILKIAHRGASAYAPENTLLAACKAIELGADGIECDVHLCKSGEVMVIHDETLQRTTNGHGRVADHTLAQLRTLDAGRGEKIPTLEELIEMIAGRAMLFIELKDETAVARVAEIVTRCAEKYGYEKLPVISFNLEALIHTKKINPRIVTGTTPHESGVPKGFIETAAKHGMWSVNPCIDTITQADVDAAHARGLKVLTWTANSADKIAKAKSLGVDGIFSDYPDQL